ncbi:MAG: ATP-binding protein [Acetobacter sp.]|nr:ATP-binding protein [Acetobacter sp.]
MLRPSSQSQKPALDPKSFHNVGTLLTKIQELKSNKKFLLPNNGHNKDFYNRLSNIQTSRNFSFLRNNENLSQNKKEEYIEEYIKGLLGFETKNTEKTKKQHQIIILDLQEASDEALGLISAVLARLIFEWIRNSDKKDRCPIHFILDEAHRYIPEKFSFNFNNDSSPQGTHIHTYDTYDTLERLAKEGRKYGIFLQVISQRPSELSKTVLSQCSNFIIHKIQNPDDLRYIRQMTPYISESITKRLPSLPQRHALVFGNAINLPVTVKIREADPPTASDDVKVSQTWFSTQEKAKQSN